MPRIDRILQRLAAFAVKIFFREVEVVGAEKVPTEGPVLFVANHVNSLVDPVLLLGCLPRAPRFLAKSTLWHNPMVKPFLILAGAIPVYRRSDVGVDTSRNVETFTDCREVLSHGGAIALFPEGVSHDQPHLMPLRTGVARIAIEAELRNGPFELKIVPIGLVFDDKQTFRSRALVLVGDTVPVSAVTDRSAGAEPEAVRMLTERVAAALIDVTPNYDSWQQARLVDRAAALFARPEAEDTRRAQLAESLPIRQAFRDGHDWMVEHEPDRVNEVAAALRRYDRLLEVAGLRDEQVAATYPRAVVTRYVTRTMAMLVVRLPLAIIGTILNWAPYRLVGRIAARSAPSPDTRATYKLFSAVFLFPTFWIGEAAAALFVGGPWAAWATAVGAPLTGYAALRFHECRRELLAEARAYLLLRSSRRGISEIVIRRHHLVALVGELARRYLAR